MRFVSSRLLVLMLVAPIALVAQGAWQTRSSGLLLLTGEFHGDEVSARNGEPWLALLLDPHGHDHIAPVRLQIDAVKDEMVDEGSAKTGRRVSFPGGPENGAFLFKNIPSIRPGRVKSIASLQSLTPNLPITLTLSPERSYKLTLVCNPPSTNGNDGRSPASLILQLGERKQILARHLSAGFENGNFVGIGNGGEVRLIWAGDLNGDGELDLIIDMTSHYNVSFPALFLGVTPSDHQVVSLTAKFMSVGC